MSDDLQDELELEASESDSEQRLKELLPVLVEIAKSSTRSRYGAFLCAIGMVVIVASMGAYRFWGGSLSTEERADVRKLRLIVGDLTTIVLNGGTMADFLRKSDECRVITGRMVLFGDRAKDLAVRSASLCLEAGTLAQLEKYSESQRMMSEISFDRRLEVIAPREYGLVARELTAKEYTVFVAKKYMKDAQRFMNDTEYLAD